MSGAWSTPVRSLTGLGYAARFFEPLERAPRRAAPERLRLDTEEAFDLRGCAPLLEESGFGVLVPPGGAAPKPA